jgi:Ca2+-binding RTX toxin-like protein
MQTALIAAIAAGGDTDWSTEVDSATRTLTVVQTVAEQAAGDTDITDSTFTANGDTEQDTTLTFTNVADASSDILTVQISNSDGTVENYSVDVSGAGGGADTFSDALAALEVLLDAAGYTSTAAAAAIQIVGNGQAFSITNVSVNDAAYSYGVTTATAFAAATVHANDTFTTDNNVITGGVDTINGGDGADTIQGMVGADVIDGGDGSDTASYASSDAAVTVNLTTGTNTGGHAAGDVLSNIENITGSALADTLVGDANANTLTGGAANDALTGNGGADVFVVADGSGSDTISDFTSSSDTMNFEGIANLIAAVADNTAKVYEEIADDGADITTNANVVVIGGVTTIGAAAAAIAADATVTGTDGIIAFSDGTDTFVYHSTDLGANGAETLVLTLTGISDATSLVAADFDLG